MNGGGSEGKKNRPWPPRRRNKRRKEKHDEGNQKEKGACANSKPGHRGNSAKPRQNNRKNESWRRHEKGQQRKVEPDSDNDPMVSIEEQLHRQRAHQQKQKEIQNQNSKQSDKTEDTKRSKVPMVLGKYRYDPERQAYFPMNGTTSRRSSRHKNSTMTEAEASDSRRETTMLRKGNPITQYFGPKSREWRSLVAFAPLTYLAQTCPSTYRRTLLRDAVGGRCIYNSMVVPSVPQSYTDRDPLEYCQNDLVCKSFLHPSCRTLDVRENPTNSRPMIATICYQDQISCRSGLLEESVALGSGIYTSVRHINFPGRPDTIFSGCLSYCVGQSAAASNASRAKFSLLNFQNQGGNFCFELNDGKPPNDFALCDNKITFAPSRTSQNGPTSFSTLHLDAMLTNWSQSVSRDASGLPVSDVFCMEADSEADFSKKCIALGHRNGQISLWDTARDRVSLVTKKTSHMSNSFGAITSLSWLSSGHEILARGSFGDSHVYDVRRMGNILSSSDSSYGKGADPSLLWVLSVPPTSEEVRSKMALYCNGIAMDPTQTVAIAPLLTKGEEPCFGCWSLTTGQWIGEKQLISNPSSGPTEADEKPPPFLELCRTTTPVFTTDEDGMIRDSSSRNRFGIWFKCGRSVPPTDGTSTQSSLRAGNIYHMTLSGGIS